MKSWIYEEFEEFRMKGRILYAVFCTVNVCNSWIDEHLIEKIAFLQLVGFSMKNTQKYIHL